jgi:hypothetical protein
MAIGYADIAGHADVWRCGTLLRETRPEKEMSIACRTLVFVEKPELMQIVARALPLPNYELEFIQSIEETDHLADRVELLVVDSKFLEDKKIAEMRRHIPTVVIESEILRVPTRESVACGDESDPKEESERIRNTAEKLLRKDYFDRIIDALVCSK